MLLLTFYRMDSGHSHQPKDRVGDDGELDSFFRKNQDFLFLKNFAPLREKPLNRDGRLGSETVAVKGAGV
jgi:hypothetical protein